MNVRRLALVDHPILQQLDAYLAALEPPAPPHHERGDLALDLRTGPPPYDRTRPLAFRFHRMEWDQPLWMPIDASLASVNYFPPGGSGLGWHTDSSRPGWRVYIGRPVATLPGALLVAGAAYCDMPGKALAFYVSGIACATWHAVQAPSERFSVGLRCEAGSATARLLGLTERA